jgi:hypothetical protein
MPGAIEKLRKAVESACTPAASGQARTWVLALGFVALFDVAITRTWILWGPTTFEHTRDLSRQQFGQTYRATRALYEPVPAPRRVVVLGNSRAYMGARPGLLEAELAARRGGAETRVDNLAIFGAGLGDQEVLARHLPRDDSAAVVLMLDATDLLDTTALPLSGAPSRLLDVGLCDGPLSPPDQMSRIARWARTVWPLFRFHEFARAAIADRLLPEAPSAPFPDHFADLHAVLAYRYGGRAPAVEVAYGAWREQPDLARFVAYLEQASPDHVHLVRARTRQATKPGSDGPGVRVLRVLLDRLAERRHALVVLVPENPILNDDVTGEFHRPGLSDRVASLVGAESAARSIPLADLRRALGVPAFLDFDHPVPGLAGLERRIAEEIARANGA